MVEKMFRWYRQCIVRVGCAVTMLIWAMIVPAEAWEAMVVDAGTGKSVPGVITIFYREEPIPGPDGGYERIIHAREFITEQGGILKNSGVLSRLFAPRTLYFYKPGYHFKRVSVKEVSNTGRVELVKVAMIVKDRRAAAADFEGVVAPILRCRETNTICSQDLIRSPAAINSEYELLDIIWEPLLIVTHGRTVVNKLRTAGPRSKKGFPVASNKSRSGKSSSDLLIKISQSPDFRVRQKAAYSLGRSGIPGAEEALIAALEDDHDQVRYAAARALGKLAAVNAVPPLAGALGDANETVREAAGEALTGMGAAVSSVVIRVLSDPNPLARERAVRVLSKTRGAQVVAALIPVLEDPDAKVRKSAAIALGVLNDPLAVKPLLARIAVETVPMVKSAVFNALERMGNPIAVSPMSKIFMGDPKGAGRLAGRVLMATDPEGIQALVNGLKHPNPVVRAESADLIGMSGNQVGTLPLVAALKDEDFRVRVEVIKALGCIGDARALTSLLDLWSHPSADLRTRAADAVVNHGQLAVTPLVGYLNAKNPYYRWRAAWALGNLSSAVAPAMGHERRSTCMKRKRVSDPGAIAALIRAVDDPLPEVRWCAIRSLGALAAEAAASALEAKLVDDDAGIRAAASDALTLIRNQ